MQIIYKPNIRHGYAKVQNDQIILIAPRSRSQIPSQIAQLQALGQKLALKLQKKQKNQIFTPDGVLLFGERVPYAQLPSFHNPQGRTHFFKSTLYEYANPLLQNYAAQLGFSNIPLRISLAKSKRGSCSSDNRIMLNQNLVHLPSRLILYVILHEVCHLREKNHAPAFRNLLASLLPNAQLLRKELKNHFFESLE